MPTINRPPVVFLLPMWGENYIEKFFAFSLPTLLASGNIPSMSQEYECSFIFLVRKNDIEAIKERDGFRHLSLYCKVEFIEISDLIYEFDNSGIHNVTVALAYDRGIRSRGEQICQTYFFFLVSDAITTNNSFHNIKHYLKAGYSAITLGGFRVTEELFEKELKKMKHPNEPWILELDVREILSLVFQFLHPQTLSEVVNDHSTHTAYANRLLWKVNEKTMIGRFYTRHMLCIKPETKNYLIGAPCDYCFIPEMCPSGKVAHIQDSDEFFMFELSPSNHDSHHIESGPFDQSQLVKELSELMTDIQRKNAHIPIIYHCEDIDESIPPAIEMSEAFVRSLEKQLPQKPQPVRGHPCWISALEYILQKLRKEPNKDQFYHRQEGTVAGIIGSPRLAPFLENRFDDFPLLEHSDPMPKIFLRKKNKARLKKIFLGTSLHASFWHLKWFDELFIKNEFKNQVVSNTPYVFIAFSVIPEIIRWLESSYPSQITYQHADFLVRRSANFLNPIFRDKQHVIIWFKDRRLEELERVIKKIANFLPPESSISIYMQHEPAIRKQELNAYLDRLSAECKIECKQVNRKYSFAHFYFHRASIRYADNLFYPGKGLITRSFGFIGLSILILGSIIGNTLNFLGFTSKKKETSTYVKLKSAR